MHPTVMATLADQHRTELLQAAEQRRRARSVTSRRTTPDLLTRTAGALRAVLPQPRPETQPCCA